MLPTRIGHKLANDSYDLCNVWSCVDFAHTMLPTTLIMFLTYIELYLFEKMSYVLSHQLSFFTQSYCLNLAQVLATIDSMHFML